MNSILITLSMETRACFDKFKKLFFFATLCCNLTAFAHLGFEHQSEIVESLFGPKYLEDDAVKELVDYISKGMDFGDVSREATLTKPGSSFLNAVREKFPNFKGSHREFGHWAFDGDIPREVIQNFENVYPGKGDDFKGLWRQFVRTRREATRLGLGLAEDGGSRAAQSITSLAGSCHDLGDWTTAQTKGLPPIENIIRDIERSYHRLLGNNNKIVSDFIADINSIPVILHPHLRAEQIIHRWKANATLHQATESVLKQSGFNGKFRHLNFKLIERYDRFASRSITRTAIMPCVSYGKSIGKPISSGGGKVSLRAGSRSVFKYLGWATPPIVDIGFLLWGDYKIQDEYTKGKIHESERREKRVVNIGRTVGGTLGALGGAAAGDYINKKYGPGSDGGDGGFGGLALTVLGALIGGFIGDELGGETTKIVYEWVSRPPNVVCSEACEIGDIDAMFFNGIYLYEGRYVEQDKNSAAWWFECAAREGDIRAQFYLGDYWSNVADPKNSEMAAFWWKLAADSNVDNERYKECKAAAAYNLASCYFNGEGVILNELLGIYYLNRAKLLGNRHASRDLDKFLENLNAEVNKANPDSGALKLLGNYYDLLDGDENKKRAFEYKRKAAELGNMDALNNVGVAYEDGKGVEKDLAYAIRYYKEASDNGHTIAIRNLGNLYKKLGIWDDDTISWLIDQANKEHSESCILLADLAWQAANGDPIKSCSPFADCSNNELIEMYIKLLERAEVMGSEKAKFLLALASENATLAPFLSDSSLETYENRLRSASFSNYQYAQLMLAKAFKTGTKIPKNESKAAFFFALAAINGIAEAQFEYGVCCYYGKGTPKNLGKAVRWFLLAANQGYPLGEYWLGWCYAHGVGIRQDKANARYWLQKALKDGLSGAAAADVQKELDNL